MRAVITTQEQAATVLGIARDLMEQADSAATELRMRKLEAEPRYKEQLAAGRAKRDLFGRSQAYWMKRVEAEYGEGWNSPYYMARRKFQDSWLDTYRTLEELRDRLATLSNHINFAVRKVGEPIHIELSHEDLILLDNTATKIDNRLNGLYEGEN